MMNSRSLTALLLCLCLPACDGGGSPGDGADTILPDGGYSPDVEATGWGGVAEKGVPNPGGKCTTGGGGTPMKLPLTGVEYCIKAGATCAEAGASCPLFVTINTDGAFFGRVDQPDAIIVAELYTETDGPDIKDKLAELPRVVANDHAGLDKDRVYAVGWSAGSGAVGRGLCHISKKSDFSSIGTTSDIYAAVVGMGGCGCANEYIPLEADWHILTWNGMDDQFNGGDACEEGLRRRAVVNGCADPTAPWQPVLATDAYAKNADGSDKAEKLAFSGCAGGDVVGYRFRDEGHVVSADEHFDPKISGYDTIYRFLDGKTKR
jgi:hypothetical protein